MFANNSPWIHQLKRDRPLAILSADTETDVTVVGGGIAGVATAYFILKNTSSRVILIEGTKVAHGATGHNAGQIVSYFERQISDIAKEFGKEMASDAQKAIDSAWDLIEDIYKNTKLTTPFSQFTGYAGLKDLEAVMLHLENNLFARDGGLNAETMFISDSWEDANKIPKEFENLYSLVPKESIKKLLETRDDSFVAVISARKGCMNSALFTEELVGYLLAQYKERFFLAENSLVQRIVLNPASCELRLATGINVKSKKIVLCTNGFESITIDNLAGKDINTAFHHEVIGRVGFMAGYLDELNEPPIAISYLSEQPYSTDAPYIYLTRRPFELEQNEKHNLICIGGPDTLMDDSNNYTKEHPYPEEAMSEIEDFLKHSYSKTPKKVEYKYKWHGLMGYTPNRVRLIGEEPRNKNLLYNLGCNGIGILPSVYGAEKISKILAGEKLPPSIFDPKEGN